MFREEKFTHFLDVFDNETTFIRICIQYALTMWFRKNPYSDYLFQKRLLNYDISPTEII